MPALSTEKLLAQEESPLHESKPASLNHWYLHRSTWILTLVFALFFLLVTMCGIPNKDNNTGIVNALLQLREKSGSNQHQRFYLHGWPWTFLVRIGIDPGYPQDDYPPWLLAKRWFGGPWAVYSFGALLFDTIVLLAAIGLFALFLERRRRPGIRLWQFTLRELLAATVLLAVAMSVYVVKQRQRSLEFAYLGKNGAPQLAWNCRAPVILQRTLGSGVLRCFDVVEDVSTRSDDDDSKIFASCLKNSPNIVQIEFYQHQKDIVNDDVIESLRTCSNLETIYLENVGKAPDVFQVLADLPRLNRVCLLYGTTVSNQTLEEFKRKKPDCVVER